MVNRPLENSLWTGGNKVWTAGIQFWHVAPHYRRRASHRGGAVFTLCDADLGFDGGNLTYGRWRLVFCDWEGAGEETEHGDDATELIDDIEE